MIKTSLSRYFIEYGPKLAVSLCIGLTALAIYFIIKKAVTKIASQQNLNPQILNLLHSISKYSIGAITVTLILENLQIHIGPLIAALGVTSIGIGFAMKDIISNIIAGILILLYKPFKLGDTISTGNHQGIVRSIDLRFTILQHENKKILIPNTIMYTSIITVNEEEKK